MIENITTMVCLWGASQNKCGHNKIDIQFNCRSKAH